jgi:hypothetical protein
MVMPWNISGDELDQWTDRISAQEKLSELIRRLLLATAPLEALEIRGDGGIRLGGVDATVLARQGGPFWPGGVSIWELSTRKDIRTKLEEDYAARVKAPPEPAQPAADPSISISLDSVRSPA